MGSPLRIVVWVAVIQTIKTDHLNFKLKITSSSQRKSNKVLYKTAGGSILIYGLGRGGEKTAYIFSSTLVEKLQFTLTFLFSITET